MWTSTALSTPPSHRTIPAFRFEFHLDTLGRGAPPALWHTNIINSPSEFLQFGQRVEDYWRSLTETNGVPTDYIAEPIENLPGFAALVDGYSPSTLFNTSYERFMTVHGKLKSWHQTLLYWASDARHMSWMNAVGQTMVRALERDAFRELNALEAKARDHFERGTPLVVEDTTLNFLQNFDRIPRPTINIVRNVFLPANNHLLIGYVNFGTHLYLSRHTPSLLRCFVSQRIIRSGSERISFL